jgi:hypothetical protein
MTLYDTSQIGNRISEKTAHPAKKLLSGKRFKLESARAEAAVTRRG